MTTLSSTERGEHTPGLVERQLIGRALFLEDRGEVKSPALMREAADLISELVGALERLLSNRHVHVASGDGDRCYSCQRDLRDPVHYRADEGPNTDREFARAVATKARGGAA